MQEEKFINDECSSDSVYEGIYCNFYVDNVEVLTLQELLALSQFYVDVAKDTIEYFDKRETFHNPILWPFDEWPEIFVTKYGLE